MPFYEVKAREARKGLHLPAYCVILLKEGIRMRIEVKSKINNELAELHSRGQTKKMLNIMSYVLLGFFLLLAVICIIVGSTKSGTGGLTALIMGILFLIVAPSLFLVTRYAVPRLAAKNMKTGGRFDKYQRIPVYMEHLFTDEALFSTTIRNGVRHPGRFEYSSFLSAKEFPGYFLIEIDLPQGRMGIKSGRAILEKTAFTAGTPDELRAFLQSRGLL
ncbi:hypothetical protein FACS1894211_09830 [Clostridia bacterium]|nr:hypothetical protein FACS1894211_09830 [Clostridia bacterium]